MFSSKDSRVGRTGNKQRAGDGEQAPNGCFAVKERSLNFFNGDKLHSLKTFPAWPELFRSVLCLKSRTHFFKKERKETYYKAYLTMFMNLGKR